MKTDTLKMGIVGVNGIAQLTHLPLLKKMPNVEVVAICDSDRECATRIAEKFDIARVYHNIDEMLQFCEVDAVDICTAVEMHLPGAITALENGKHVLIEKPFARNLEEAQQIVATAHQYERKIMPMMNLRFRPDAVILKSILDNNTLGEIFYVKAGWLRKNEKWQGRQWFKQNQHGVIMTLGFQLIDLGIWLLGNPGIQHVKAVHFNKIMKSQHEDSAVVFIHLDNNVSFTVEVSWSLKYAKDFLYLNLVGNQGAARLNPLTILKEQDDGLVDITPSQKVLKRRPYLKSYENEFAHFIYCVLNDQPIQSSGKEIVKRFKIVDAIYHSAETGKEVELT